MPKRKFQGKIYKKKKRVLKILLQIFAIGFIVVYLIGLGTFAIFFKDLPRPEKFTEGIIAQTTKLYDRTGEVLLYEIAGKEKRTIVPLSEIPDHLEHAFITTEDRKFYEHKGVDIKAIFRSIIYDLKIGAPAQGASTISQQLIRSYFLTLQKTIQRKTREIILTLELERRYSKEQILEWYLNLIPFGSNLYGVEAASQTFFSKPVKEITIAESALLAGLIRSPSRLSPYGHYLDELLSLKDYIISEMAVVGYITTEQAEEALAQEIVFAEIQHSIKAPHFVLFVKKYLEDKYGASYLSRAGLKVITTLDYDLQEYAETLMAEKIKSYEGYNAFNGGLISINPKNGELLTMVGSKEYFSTSHPEGCLPGIDCQFDPQVNVTLSKRQPGSAFKPFAYAEAFILGLSPETLVWDAPTEFNPNCPIDIDESIEKEQEENYDKTKDPCYHPQNYTGRFYGLTNLRNALAQSKNLPAVKVLYLAGLQNTLNLVKSFGLSTLSSSGDYGLSLVLGGGEVQLIEMVSAYGVFANNGTKTAINFIKEIKDKSGKVIEAQNKSAIKVLPSQVAMQINDVLSDNNARAPLFGYNSVLNLGNNVAVKTGTTQRNNDAWTIGYSPNIATGVWVGNNDNSEMDKPGVSLAGPIWRNFMVYALGKLPIENFTPPLKTTTSTKPMIAGVIPQENHSILHYVNKKDPTGPAPTNPAKYGQYEYWEFGILKFLGLIPDNSTTTPTTTISLLP